VTAGGKAMDVANDGAQRSTRQSTDAGDLAQLLDAHIGASQRIQLVRTVCPRTQIRRAQ
jgi:hypothetical protein